MLEKTKTTFHSAFKITMLFKGIYSLLEIGLGFLAFFASKTFLSSSIYFFSHEELIEDSNDFLINYLLTAVQNISPSTKYFFAFYLLSHGIIKLFLIISLLKQKLWAYPISIIIFTLFIFYQIYRYLNTSSIGLLLLTILDFIIIILTIYEYRHLKSKHLTKKLKVL